MKKIFWIASYPKSGNTWMRAIISSLFFSKDGIFDFKFLKSIRNFESSENYEFVKSINIKDYKNLNNLDIISKYRLEAQKRFNQNLKNKNVVFFKTHSANVSIKNFPYTSKNTAVGLIYMVRDPRDIVISYSSHKNASSDEIINLLINEMATYSITNPQFLSSWNHHYNSWIGLDVPKIIIKYEDLFKNTEKKIWDIVYFFNNNFNIKFENIEIKINNILNSTNFKKLQDHETKYGFNESVNNKFFSGPYGGRTRGRRIKSPSLYLTKLKARHCGSVTTI